MNKENVNLDLGQGSSIASDAHSKICEARRNLQRASDCGQDVAKLHAAIGRTLIVTVYAITVIMLGLGYVVTRA